MLYYIFRPLTRIALLIFFKKIYISGEGHLPDRNSAIILACNHPNGFLEPIILACFLKFPLHFLVRGDLFKNKMLKPILIGTNQIPIFRFKDGFSALKNNIDTMQDSLQIIGDKKVLLIYPEGTTQQSIYLRKIKKGTARLAVQAKLLYDKLPIKLVPIGINYTNPNAFRSELMIEIGKAIDVRVKGNNEVPYNRQIMELTERLEGEMKQLVKQVDNPEDEAVVISLLHIKAGFDKHNLFPLVKRSNVHLKDDQLFVQQFNELQDKELIHKKIQVFNAKLYSFGLSQLIPEAGIVKIILKSLLLILLIPMALLSSLVHFIPVLIVKHLIRKYVKHKEFHTSVLIAGSAGLIVILYIILCLLFVFIQPRMILLIPLFIISIFCAAYFYDNFRYLSNQLILKRISKQQRERLYADSNEILHFFYRNK